MSLNKFIQTQWPVSKHSCTIRCRCAHTCKRTHAIALTHTHTHTHTHERAHACTHVHAITDDPPALSTLTQMCSHTSHKHLCRHALPPRAFRTNACPSADACPSEDTCRNSACLPSSQSLYEMRRAAWNSLLHKNFGAFLHEHLLQCSFFQILRLPCLHPQHQALHKEIRNHKACFLTCEVF